MKYKILTTLSILLGFLTLHFYIPRFITEINNPIIKIIKGNVNQNEPLPYISGPNIGKKIEIKSFDDVKLKGFLSYSKTQPTKGSIILLHGIRGYKEHFVDLSSWLTLKGYNTLALDSRAHGESEGQFCTFGVKEKQDLKSWIDTLIFKENITSNIGVWGQSLGGAIGLQALAFDQRLKFGIIESTFTNFKTISNDYFQYHLGFEWETLNNYLINRAGKLSDFNIDEASPLKYAPQVKQNILLVHGTKDKRIDIKYSRINFESIGSKNKSYLPIKNANHLTVWQEGGEDYLQKVDSFLNRTLQK